MHVTLDPGKEQFKARHFCFFQPRIAIPTEKQITDPANEWRF
jgi:hypothetical protein